MRLRQSIRILIVLIAAQVQLWCQTLSPPTPKKICVAQVANQTTILLLEDRMTARMMKGLGGGKWAAEAMDSATPRNRDLRPSVENGQEMKRRECDYVVLTVITTTGTVTQSRLPGIQIGAKVPSTDASDPMGGQSGPVYRDELEINFALYRVGNPEAKLNSSLLDRPSANAADSLMQAMDRVASRVTHELKKK